MLIKTSTIERIIDARLRVVAGKDMSVYNYEPSKSHKPKDDYILFYVSDARFNEFTFNRQLSVGEYDLTVEVWGRTPSDVSSLSDKVVNTLVLHRDNVVRRVEYDGITPIRSQPIQNPLYFKIIDFTLRTQ